MNKKRHHYISQVYLRSFCNAEGKICIYSKDKGGEHWFGSPRSIAAENYYYSQPKADGDRDHNRLEDFFSKLEGKWAPLIEHIEHRKEAPDGLKALLDFVLMHRVRVPTARTAVERMLAEAVRMTGRYLHEQGSLPRPPMGLSYDELERLTVISIDPHRSILAMADLAKGMGKVFEAVGFEILENETNEEFTTNDNPVVYFDPTMSEASVQPYNISREKMDIELLFPITPRFLLWGHSVLKGQFDRRGIPYRRLEDEEFVQRANRFIARFAHRHIFSRTEQHGPLVARYAGTSPVISIAHIKTRTVAELLRGQFLAKGNLCPSGLESRGGS